MSDHPGTADPLRRRRGRGNRAGRRPARAGLGARLPAGFGAHLALTLLLGSTLLVASCASGGTASSGTAARQLEFGVAMAQRGLWSEALFRFERAQRLDPNSFRVLNNLAVAYEANGRFDDALATYRRALALDPANRELRRNYARFVEFYQSFRPEETIEEEAGAAGAPAASGAAQPAAPDGESAAEPARGPGKEIEP
jgi:Tfp pilus assembly protein PilF